MRLVYCGLWVCLAACHPERREEWYTRPIYPPSRQVELLDAWPERRETIVLGTLTTGTDQDSLSFIMRRAMEAGADAVVLGHATRYEVTVPVGSGHPGSRLAAEPYAIPLEQVRAVLLRYPP